MTANYILDIVILLAAAVIAVPLFRVVGFGAVPGFLIAGVAVGPSGLALIDNVTEIGRLAELGVVLLLFVIGIELKPSRLWAMRRLVFGLGTLQVISTGVLITAAVHLLLDVTVRAAAVIGPALALSSTAFVLQILSERRALHSEHGRASLAVLLLQDLAVVPLLALVPLLATQHLSVGTDLAIALVEAVVILLAVVAGGRYLLQPLLHRVAQSRSKEIFTAVTVLLVLGSALLTEHLGLSMAMGAFIAGLLIADSPFRHEVVAEIEPFRGLLLGLFFMSMGMSLEISQFVGQPFLTIGLVGALIAVKFAVLWPLAMAFGLGARTAAAVALLLAQSGEFGLVLFAYAFESALLDTELFQQLLVVVVLSMLLTPPLAYLAQQLASTATTRSPPDRPEEAAKAPVVLAGFGRVGRRIGEIFTSAGVPYVAIDQDSSLVLRQRAKGYRVFYGDGRKPDVLRSLGVADASLVIVTVNDFEATESIVAALHRAHPDLTILARGHDASQCQALRKLGASLAISENLEASLDLAREALLHQLVGADQTEEVLRRFRADYYANF
ncbi:MAG: monovalent cation:proton antiporter-2 (CPA2) family protein [Gammaproteobacteria bacterium]|jgi:monovalent cation:proton antiporter-2 (CPA2) family protein